MLTAKAYGQQFGMGEPPFYTPNGHVVPHHWQIIPGENREDEHKRMLAYGEKYMEGASVIEQYGTWAVTSTGMDCLTHYYWIKKERLFSGRLIEDMGDHYWCDMGDFAACLKAAQAYHKRPKPEPAQYGPMSKGRRFLVLKRDGFRCQLCGKTSADGVILEVDHKVPKSKGGSNHDSNLWTLCFECNRGKGTKDLEAPRA